MNVRPKRLLVFAHYYAPDVAATAQLYQELCEGLRGRFDITVVCAAPSYLGVTDARGSKAAFTLEEMNGVTLLRVRVPPFSKQNRRSRVRHMLAYFVGGLLAALCVSRMDVVLALSQPPILGGLLGVWGKWITGGKLIYHIQDLNPEQASAARYIKGASALRLMMALDKFSCRRASLVVLPGRDMRRACQDRFRGRRVPPGKVIANWADEARIRPLPKSHPGVAEFRARYDLTDRFVIMYSGNIGLYYDLPRLVRLFGAFEGDARVRFVLVGDGALRAQLQDFCHRQRMQSVVFIPYQPKERLVYSLNAADVHIVCSQAGLRGASMPCKLYGALAANVPVLGILEPGSEAWDIIRRSGAGILAVAGDDASICAALDRILREGPAFVRAHQAGRAYLRAHLSKRRALRAFATAIEEV